MGFFAIRRNLHQSPEREARNPLKFSRKYCGGFPMLGGGNGGVKNFEYVTYSKRSNLFNEIKVKIILKK